MEVGCWSPLLPAEQNEDVAGGMGAVTRPRRWESCAPVKDGRAKRWQSESEDHQSLHQLWADCIYREVKSLSRVQLFATPRTVACQSPPSIGFSRQEYWSGLPFPFREKTSFAKPGIVWLFCHLRPLESCLVHTLAVLDCSPQHSHVWSGLATLWSLTHSQPAQ